MANTANARVAAAADTNRGFGKMHGVGKQTFSFTPSTGASQSSARTALREKVKMRAPKGSPAGKSPTSYSSTSKGLIVRGKAKLMG